MVIFFSVLGTLILVTFFLVLILLMNNINEMSQFKTILAELKTLSMKNYVDNHEITKVLASMASNIDGLADAIISITNVSSYGGEDAHSDDEDEFPTTPPPTVPNVDNIIDKLNNTGYKLTEKEIEQFKKLFSEIDDDDEKETPPSS